MSNHTYHSPIARAKRHLKRIEGRIERYQGNVDYFTKYPDSNALQLNVSLLETDKQAYRQLTGRCYPLSK